MTVNNLAPEDLAANIDARYPEEFWDWLAQSCGRFCNGKGTALSGAMTTWAEAVGPARRVLLIVNSSAAERGELAHVLDALQRHADADRICVIAPLAVVGELLARGVRARSILSFELESGFFLQSDRALQWAIRQHADIVVGSEP